MINYQIELDKELEKIKDKKPKLLLHVCCAPCSSYVLEYLSNYFEITVLYYNPNISPYEEYERRLNEEKRLIKEMNKENIKIMECEYDNELFEQMAKGLENVKEGQVFNKEGNVAWICKNCGHIHFGESAPEVCPTCDHPQAYFEIHAENY